MKEKKEEMGGGEIWEEANRTKSQSEVWKFINKQRRRKKVVQPK